MKELIGRVLRWRIIVEIAISHSRLYRGRLIEAISCVDPGSALISKHATAIKYLWALQVETSSSAEADIISHDLTAYMLYC